MRFSLQLAIFVPLILLVLQACAPKPEEACGFVQNSQGQRVSWQNQVPVNLYIHQDVPAQFYPAIREAVDSWERQSGLRLFRLADTAYRASQSPQDDGLNVIYWMQDWESNRSTEQARTVVYYAGDTITNFDIRINAKNYNFFVDRPKTTNEVHFASLILHELGHGLGLKHQDGVGSVMATVLPSQTQRMKVSAGDLQSLKCEY